MEAIKVTIGEKTSWHHQLKDGVATVTTADESVKEALCALAVKFPDAVQLMYDGEDLCAEDMEGPVTFFVDEDTVEFFVKPGSNDFGIRVWEKKPEIEVIDHEEGDVI